MLEVDTRLAHGHLIASTPSQSFPASTSPSLPHLPVGQFFQAHHNRLDAADSPLNPAMGCLAAFARYLPYCGHGVVFVWYVDRSPRRGVTNMRGRTSEIIVDDNGSSAGETQAIVVSRTPSGYMELDLGTGAEGGMSVAIGANVLVVALSTLSRR